MSVKEIVSKIKEYHFEVCGYGDNFDEVEASAYHFMAENDIPGSVQSEVIESLKSEY